MLSRHSSLAPCLASQTTSSLPFFPSRLSLCHCRYECSQTIECGLPLSRVLDALQLLGQGHVALRCDFIFESIDLGTDASSKAKVILGSTTHQRMSLIPRRRLVHKLVTECAGVYQPFTVGYGLHHSLYSSARPHAHVCSLVDNGAVSSCGRCSLSFATMSLFFHVFRCSRYSRSRIHTAQ